ncbi:hypothetical protein OBO34_18340 [Clostridiales Family XIII bacterium ASD5510]|uniref:Uncharacterized protein n=1 Tax=Hominibacterium faecale TaxID=2839743 RepID=A0A9J6QXS0_9FIRM|nr:hypothetical protein [Hominibacterium faecale]MCU7380292.1 hypothetical protein [Hominibacterium faecale]
MEQNIREIKELLVMIYDEVKEVKVRVTNLERGFANLLERATLLENKVEAMDTRISNLESSMDNRISNLESSMDERISNLESSMDERISNLESSMGERISSLESSMGERISSLESRLAGLEVSMNELNDFSRQKTAELHHQAQRNFEILETDLGAAIDWSKFLQEQKVDKEALKKAAV